MSPDQYIDLEPYDPEEDKPAAKPAPAPSPAPSAPGSLEGAKPAQISRSADVQPLSIEAEPEPRKPIPVGIPIDQAADSPPSSYSVKDLDVCPSCGAPMRGKDTLVCTRCGFDLKTMKNFKTATGVIEINEEAQRAEELERTISRPGRGDLWLPGCIAGICGAVLFIAYLAGVPGLFPGHAVDEINFGLRSSGVLRFLILSVMWTACGMAGLFCMAYLLGKRVGELQLAAMRMLAITMVMQLIMIIGFSPVWVERLLEVILQVGAFGLMSLAFFNLKPKDAPYLVVSSVAVFFVLWLGSAVVFWATTGA